MRNYPEVSIVVVAFNRATMLNEILEQIRNQSFKNFEVIICDDCSTDNTNEIAIRFVEEDNRFRYIRNQINIKMPHNLNNGIKQSKSKYIAILHDDDIIVNDTIEKWYQAITDQAKPAFAFNEYICLDENLKLVEKYSEHLPFISTGEHIMKKIFYNRKTFGSPVWGSVMVRKDSLLGEGLFDNEYGFYSDVDMWLKLCEKNNIAYIKEPLVYIRNKKSAPHLFDDDIEITQKIIQSIFLASRVRYIKRYLIRGIAEIAKHYCFKLYTSMYIYAIKIKQTIKVRNNSQS